MAEESNESRVVRVKLYKSNLEEMKGMFYAGLSHERTLSVGDVCDIVHERGGFTGDPRVMEDHVIRFFDEMCRQVCNGLTVNMAGYLSASAHVTGIFQRLREGVTPEKHHVEICFQTGAKFHEAAELIEVYVEGLAEPKAFIGAFTDVKTKLVNRKATAGGLFSMTGNLMKIFGPDPRNGLRFTTPGNPPTEVRVLTGDLAVNESRRIAGIVPDLPPGKRWTLEITTQFAKSSTPLKEPKVITSDFTVAS
jgi:hypothetical protein